MITSDVYIGTKVCETCLDRIIAVYIFLEQTKFFKTRLGSCIQSIINHLKQIEKPETNVFIEISPDAVLPRVEGMLDSDLEGLDKSDADEDDYKVSILEDEFRVEESSTKSDESSDEILKSYDLNDSFDRDEPLKNLASQNIKTYSKKKVNSIPNEVQNTIFNNKKVEQNHVLDKNVKREKTRKNMCPICGKHFISEYFLIRHMKTHRYRKVECKQCGKILGSTFLLREHTKMTHRLNISYYLSCVVCLRSFSDESKLLKHMNLHRKYDCLLCNKSFIYFQHYYTHIKRHSSSAVVAAKTCVSCSFCEKQYKCNNLLDFHVNRTHLQIKPYNCIMCDQKFYTKNDMRNHKVLHRMRSKDVCKICDKVLNSRVKLLIHIRKHFDIKPYQCDFCGEYFYTVHKRNKHLSNVHGGKFHCKLCNSGFEIKIDLKFHVKNSHCL